MFPDRLYPWPPGAVSRPAVAPAAVAAPAKVRAHVRKPGGRRWPRSPGGAVLEGPGTPDAAHELPAEHTGYDSVARAGQKRSDLVHLHGRHCSDVAPRQLKPSDAVHALCKDGAGGKAGSLLDCDLQWALAEVWYRGKRESLYMLPSNDTVLVSWCPTLIYVIAETLQTGSATV